VTTSIKVDPGTSSGLPPATQGSPVHHSIFVELKDDGVVCTDSSQRTRDDKLEGDEATVLLALRLILIVANLILPPF
jgi:hypothetical protein